MTYVDKLTYIVFIVRKNRNQTQSNINAHLPLKFDAYCFILL